MFSKAVSLESVIGCMFVALGLSIPNLVFSLVGGALLGNAMNKLKQEEKKRGR